MRTPLRCRPNQGELFCPLAKLPQLPPETHQKMLRLLARMLNEHLLRRPSPTGVEVSDSRDVFEVVFNTLGVRHSGSACCNTRSRNFTDKNFGVSTDTCTPSNSSASCSSPASVNKVVESVGSTSKSRSLPSVSVPVKTDPKTRGRDRPWRLTSCRNAARCVTRAYNSTCHRDLYIWAMVRAGRVKLLVRNFNRFLVFTSR